MTKHRTNAVRLKMSPAWEGRDACLLSKYLLNLLFEKSFRFRIFLLIQYREHLYVHFTPDFVYN